MPYTEPKLGKSLQSLMPSAIYSELKIAFIGLYAMAVTIGVGRFLFTATLPDITNQLNISTQMAGSLASINYFGYFLGALIAMFVPAAHTWRVLTVSLVASVLTTMILAVPLSLPLWFMMRLLSGVASSVGMILGSTYLLSYFSHDNRWVLSTVHYSGIGIGIVLSSLVTLVLFLMGTHFDVVWGVCGLLSLPLLYFIFRLRPADFVLSPVPTGTDFIASIDNNNRQKVAPSDNQDGLFPKKKSPSIDKRTLMERIHPSHIKQIWREVSAGHSATIFLVCLSYLLAGFGYVTSATFLPLMAEKALDNHTQIGLIVWMVVGMFTAIANPVWGRVANNFGAGKTVFGLLLLQTVGMFMPVWLEGEHSAVGLYINAAVLGATFIGIVSLTLMLLKEINPKYANLLMGLGTVMYSIGQFVGPMVTVAISGPDGGLNQGLMAAGLVLLIAAALMVPVIMRE